MRPFLFSIALMAMTACFNSLTLPRDDGALELFVKTNHTDVLSDLSAGGGPALTEAMVLAGVPETDRPARLIQLQSDAPLYEQSPAALVTALRVYGAASA